MAHTTPLALADPGWVSRIAAAAVSAAARQLRGTGNVPTTGNPAGILGTRPGDRLSGDLFYFTDPVTFWERLRVMGNILTFQFVPVLLLGMGVGLILLIIHDKLLAWLFGERPSSSPSSLPPTAPRRRLSI
ncbi:MAG: hypothetical protein R3C44_16825 [Chloroflexota bacterium]